MQKNHFKAFVIWVATACLLAGCGSPDSRLKKAQAAASGGQHQKAVQLFQVFIQKYPHSPLAVEAYEGLGKSLDALGRLPEACEAAGHAAALAGSDSEALAAGLLYADLAKRAGLAAAMAEAGGFLCRRANKNPLADIKVVELLNTLVGKIIQLQAVGQNAEREKAALAALLNAAGALKIDPDLKAKASGLAAAAAGPSAKVNVGQLDATQITVGSVSKGAFFDAAAFPFVTQISDNKLLSPDGKSLLWRQRSGFSFYLKISDANGKNIQTLKACKNGFQPSWAPDSNKILYTAINWKHLVRSIYVYDLKAKKTNAVFKAPKGVGALAAWSPDGSKIVFTYRHQLWLINQNGIGLVLLNINQPVKEAQLFAWSKDGSRLVYQPRGTQDFYTIELVSRL